MCCEPVTPDFFPDSPIPSALLLGTPSRAIATILGELASVFSRENQPPRIADNAHGFDRHALVLAGDDGDWTLQIERCDDGTDTSYLQHLAPE